MGFGIGLPLTAILALSCSSQVILDKLIYAYQPQVLLQQKGITGPTLQQCRDH